MIRRLFQTKSIEQILADADHPDHRLKKTLTAWDLTALGIGAIIGTVMKEMKGQAEPEYVQGEILRQIAN